MKRALNAALLFFLVLSPIIVELTSVSRAHAVSASEWQAGNITDDGVFYNNSDLPTVQDVQNILNAKVPTCDTGGTQPYGNTGLTDAQYAATQGWPGPPYVCLKDYYQVPRSDQDINNLGTNIIPTGAISAAQIIKTAADTYGISPRALITIIQKESPGPLVTDTWPLPSQYRNAMGYGCPDTAPCNPAYEGFYNQVMNAANQFNLYKTNPSSYRYVPFQANSIGYNPNVACGASTVTIADYATAGLYNYTPYQPNTAALSNLYGSGDSCSAYGNRNYWRTFNDWFYSTRAYSLGWRIMSQQAYSDPARTLAVNTNDLSPGTNYYFRLIAENIGSQNWSNTGPNPIRIGTNAPQNRLSVVCDASWISCARPATMNESSVAPGSNGTFDFIVHTPTAYIASNEYFNLLAEGVAWTNDIGQFWPVATLPPTPNYNLVYEGAFLDSAYSKPLNTNDIAPGQSYYVKFKALNTGNTTWVNSGPNPTRLGTSGPQNRSSAFYDSSWTAANRPATLQEASVAPGQVGTFAFKATAPAAYGTYKEYFTPLTEGLSWMNEIGLYLPFTVAPPTPEWSFAGQEVYTDSTMQTPFNPQSTPNTKRFYVVLKALNTGNTTWVNSGPNPTRLGTSGPQNRSIAFYDSSWTAANRPATLQEASVAPGQVGTFAFWMQAGMQPDGTSSIESFTPVTEGIAWMNDVGMYIPVTYSTPATAISYVSQAAYSDAAMTVPADLTNASVNTTYYLKLVMKNISWTTWTNNSGSLPVHLGTSNPIDRVSVFANNTWIGTGGNRPTAVNETSVGPGQTGTFLFSITTPGTATSSTEYFRPLVEGQYWLDDLLVNWPITVR